MSPLLANAELRSLLQQFWGYEKFLPLQAESVAAIMGHRDSLTRLQTGGGKSLCYQLPAITMPGMALVLSSSLSLLKNQVDFLVANGVAAAALDDDPKPHAEQEILAAIQGGWLKLLYLSPERLIRPDTLGLLRNASISFISIDTAHCISQWSHDFRPDYRNLAFLKTWFPGSSVHAFTAPAAPEVRADILDALRLPGALEVHGSVERPHLVYRAELRRNLLAQVIEVLERHPGEAGLIYCLRQAEVDALCESLNDLGHSALPYHAGLSGETRRAHQEAFSNETLNLMVATVACDMGCKRSNVRFVIHTGMPKSLEHYQQEAGRAGCDHLEAECILFYAASDRMAWREIMGTVEADVERHAHAKLDAVLRFCRTLECRHRSLVRYFGQECESENCGACDVCFGEHAALLDAALVSRQILSGVALLPEGFASRYVAEALKGESTSKIVENQHEKLNAFGILSEHPLNDISDWIEQLLGLGFLQREASRRCIQLSSEGRALLKQGGSAQLMLSNPANKATPSIKASMGLPPREQGVFLALRALCHSIAQERGLAPHLILSDVTLRELALIRPTSLEALRGIAGVSEAKARDIGERLLEILRLYCKARGIKQDDDLEIETPSTDHPKI